jgi:asparagine synthase (glutamine-hydrolysing)
MSGIAGCVTQQPKRWEEYFPSFKLGLSGRLLDHIRYYEAGAFLFMRGISPREVKLAKELGPSNIGNISVCSDSRLDNAADLIRVLALPQSASDNSIFAAAYLKWGTKFAAHLLGDFAIVLWDETTKSLVCCRDHFGVRGLCYLQTNNSLLFASDPRPLTCCRSFSSDFDKKTIARYLKTSLPDAESTFFESIKWLPPATVLVWQGGQVTTNPFYQLEIPTSLVQLPQVELAEEFLEILKLATATRCPSPTDTGFFLSGGLDSSSLTSLGSSLFNNCKIKTFSTVFDSSSRHNERSFQETVLKAGNFEPFVVHGEASDQLEHLTAILAEQSGPTLAAGSLINRSLYHTAQMSGVTGLIDGHGGDETISIGQGHIKDLVLRNDWYNVARELLLLDPRSALSRLLYFAGQRIIPKEHLWRVEQGHQLIARVLSKTNYTEYLISADFDMWFSQVERVQEIQVSTGSFSFDDHYNDVVMPLQAHALVFLSNMSESFGLESRFPLWDKRLVEFCIRLPGAAKFRDGLDRRILRDAMTGILPDDVRLRKGKYDFLFMKAQGLAKSLTEEVKSSILDNRTLISEYIDFSELQTSFQIFETTLAKPLPQAHMNVHQALSMIGWLQDPFGRAFASRKYKDTACIENT